MSFSALQPRSQYLQVLALSATLLVLGGCSSMGQQLAEAQIKAVNAQEVACACAQQPYLGGDRPNDPPKLTTNSGIVNSELSDSVAVPLMSFLIIEPDPVTKNAVPSDVEKLVKARQYPQAIDLINTHLKKTPRNVQLRFVKARIQLELRQFDAAKKTLIEITQQFPELPEPYNNLAALAADQGQWIEARDYLELALKLRPSYAIASANLGEIYIRLGAQAYEDAAKGTQYQRQYGNRAKALLELLKPPAKRTNIAPSKPIEVSAPATTGTSPSSGTPITNPIPTTNKP
jgi:tetratricopeptide (TPR) repeat protein